jgi:hypothetical protein
MLFIIMFRVYLSMILLGLPADNDALITITPGM